MNVFPLRCTVLNDGNSFLQNLAFDGGYGMLFARNIRSFLNETKFVTSDYGPLSYLPPAYMEDFPILPRRWDQIYLHVYFWPQKRSQVGMSLSRMQRGTPALPPGATNQHQPSCHGELVPPTRRVRSQMAKR